MISDETQRTAWVNDIRQKLEDGKWNEVLSDPSVIANKDIKTTGGKVNLYKYIDDRKDQIDYPLFRAKGYFVGSGAIESANRYMIHPPKVFFGLQISILSIFSGKMTIREGRSEFAIIPNVLLKFFRNIRIFHPSAIPSLTP